MQPRKFAICRDRKSTRLNSSHLGISFSPTRRSSDLMIADASYNHRLGASLHVEVRFLTGAHAAEEVRDMQRSEEHTSELQSLRHLLFPYSTLFRSHDRRRQLQPPPWRQSPRRGAVSHGCACSRGSSRYADPSCRTDRWGSEIGRAHV